MKLLKLVLILKTLFCWRWESQIPVNPWTHMGTSACASSKGPGSIRSSLAVGLWKSAREGAEVREAWSVQHSNKWSSDHTLKVGSWICRKADCLLENKDQSKHAPVTAMQCLAQGPPVQQQAQASRIYLKVHTDFLGIKNTVRKIMCKRHSAHRELPGRQPVGFSGLLGISFSSWHTEFTQWSSSHHFCRSRWGPADYGEKLENSKSKALESQAKKMTIFTCLMTFTVLVVAWECGGQAAQQQQTGGWTKTSYPRRVGSTATLQGQWLVICAQHKPAKQFLSLAILNNRTSSD